jgi:hypothetical protein
VKANTWCATIWMIALRHMRLQDSFHETVERHSCATGETVVSVPQRRQSVLCFRLDLSLFFRPSI